MTHTFHRYGERDYAILDANLKPVMKVSGFIEAMLLTNYLNGGSMNGEDLSLILLNTVEPGFGDAWGRDERQKYLDWYKSTEMDRMVTKAAAQMAKRS